MPLLLLLRLHSSQLSSLLQTPPSTGSQGSPSLLPLAVKRQLYSRQASQYFLSLWGSRWLSFRWSQTMLY